MRLNIVNNCRDVTCNVSTLLKLNIVNNCRDVTCNVSTLLKQKYLILSNQTQL
jgi:hypothetical protein